jgi:hypothetical protein
LDRPDGERPLVCVSELSSWLASDERLSDPAIGYWRETISVPYDRHETIYSAPWYRIGLARLPDSAIVSMTTNGYFGAARDRLPISAIDPLESPLRNQPPVAKDVSSRGRRLRVMTPKICARCDPASTGRAPGRSRLTIIMKACNRNSCAEWIS